MAYVETLVWAAEDAFRGSGWPLIRPFQRHCIWHPVTASCHRDRQGRVSWVMEPGPALCSSQGSKRGNTS